MKIGVVGAGIVGNAFYEGMKHAFQVVRFDKFQLEKSDVDNIQSLLDIVDGPIFVCVPTPMNDDGSCSTSIVEEVCQDINELCNRSKRTVVVKSTVVPGTCKKIQEKYLQLSVVFNPEFLVESNPVECFKNQNRIIIGSDDQEAIKDISKIYSIAYPNVVQKFCDLTSAELVKYVGNCFLSVKVSFANEIFEICKNLNIDYNNVVEMAKLDQRLGNSHWSVPGPDGKMGYGGKCFPKDINALINKAKELGVDPIILEASWKKNCLTRPEKDWEKISGVLVN